MLVIVGGGSEEEKLKSLIEAENLTNVVMIPVQPRYTIPLILRKSKILFGAYRPQGLKYGISKNKFYDYMAARRPIVFASNVRDSLIDKAGAGITTKSGDPNNWRMLSGSSIITWIPWENGTVQTAGCMLKRTTQQEL